VFGTSKFTVAIVSLVASSVAANVLLLRQNSQLRLTVYQLHLLLEQSGQVPIGLSLPPLIGIDSSNRELSLDVQQARGMALFVFDPGCGPCNVNWANWESLLSDVLKEGRKPVFIDLISDTVDAKFIKEHRLEKYLVLKHLADSTKLAYRFQATPETVLLNRMARRIGRGRIFFRQPISPNSEL